MTISDARTMIHSLSVARIALGVAILLLPGLLLRWFLGLEATRNAKVLARSMGGREVAVGALTLDALARDVLPPRVVELNVLVDAVDATATLLAYRRLPRFVRAIALLAAVGATAAGAQARAVLERA